MAKILSEKIQELHREACDKDEDTYIDPQTGYTVFTEIFHKKRGYCCNSGCRHCPYKTENSGDEQTS